MQSFSPCHALASGTSLNRTYLTKGQNLLDKGTALNLDIVTAELLSVHDRMERERILDEMKKRQKSDQMALVAKSSLRTSTKSNSPGMKKKFKKGHYKL